MTSATMTEPQEFATNHVHTPVTTVLTDVQVPFRRAFATCLKWGAAAILAGLILGAASFLAWTMLRVLLFGA